MHFLTLPAPLQLEALQESLALGHRIVDVHTTANEYLFIMTDKGFQSLPDFKYPVRPLDPGENKFLLS